MFTTFPASTSYGDFIFLWEQLVYSVMEKENISEFILLPHWYCKYYSSEFYTVLLLIVKRFCGDSPHCQSERQSFWDFTAFIIATCLHMFCNKPKKKKDKTSSAPPKKLPLLANLCNSEATYTSCMLLYEWSLRFSIEKWKCWFTLLLKLTTSAWLRKASRV